MAKRYDNDKDFLILEMTKEDCDKMGFGNKCDGVCGIKNNFVPRIFSDNEPRFYVACLNYLLCKDCLDEFLATQTHYEDDASLSYEETHYTNIAKQFNLIYE